MTVLLGKRIRQATGSSIMLVGIILCAGCGGDKEDTSDAAATPATGTTAGAPVDTASTATITTGPGEQQADNQVEFYTERYLKPEERLQRRQDRLKAALSR